MPVLAVLAAVAAPASGQSVGDVLGGALVGAVITLPVALGYSAVRAQSGHYIWNSDETVDRFVVVGSVVVGVSAGAVLVASDRYSVGDALLGAAVGGGVGALVGRGIAQLTATTPEGRWAGLVIGMGAGVMVGSLANTFLQDEDPSPETNAPAVGFSLPVRLPLLGR